MFFRRYLSYHTLSSLSKKAKAAADVDYPAYGVTGPTIDSSGDRKLAHSAHMYHYQHQKQQIIAMERSVNKATQAYSVSANLIKIGTIENYESKNFARPTAFWNTVRAQTNGAIHNNVAVEWNARCFSKFDLNSWIPTNNNSHVFTEL